MSVDPSSSTAGRAASATKRPPDDDDSTRVGPATGPFATPARPVDSRFSELRSISETLPGAVEPGGLAARRVGRYVIRERLGSGGMATVFKAHDPNIGRDVAIKFLHAALCEDDEYRGRFLREARAAGGLSHPNIVTVYDVGEIEGRPYMAMELLSGDSLADVMEGGKPLAVRDVLVMGIQVAAALDYAHAHGIVHRDIKPGNIVRLEGATAVKVTDFGIAHMDAAGADEQRTRVGDVLGTPQYMSPEQTQGEKLDGRSDLFSAGVMLYQMLTGQRPFQSDSLVALALKIANEQPIPIERLRKDLPSSLRRVVSRCLAKSPDRRFQTGRELADALARVLAQIDEATGKREKPRLVPLRVKWAATMALIVAVVMAVSATVITQRQVGAMMGQVTDYGASVARFIAAQNAVAALSEDWPVVDVAVQEIMKTGDFQNVTVIDREGIVRADADPSLTGKPYRAPAVKASERRKDGVTVSRFGPKEEPILGFEAPITFQGKVVGKVALAIAERPLVRVARLSMGLMAALVVITVLAVAIAMYFVGNWFAQPIRVVSEALDEITKGRLDHRIAEQRNDEFGLLFTSFDRMATSLQDRHDTVGVSSTEPDSLLPRVEPGASEEIPSASGGASMARPSAPSIPSSVRSL